MAWGLECSEWDDSVDWAVLEKFDFGKIPDGHFVMTTWHENETLEEALCFAKFDAIDNETSEPLKNLLILDFAHHDRADFVERLYVELEP